MRRREMRVFALFTGLFLLCGLLHVASFDRDWAECLVQWFCGVLLVVWGWSIHLRVTDQRLRMLLWAVVFAMLLFLTLQILAYSLAFREPTFRRWAWYGYYIPIMALAFLLFAISEVIYLSPSQSLSRWVWVAAAAVGILVLLILTNDLHQWVFRFHSIPFRDEDKSNGALFYIIYLVFVVILIVTFRTILKKAEALPIGPSRWLPTVPMILLGGWLILNMLKLKPTMHGVHIWNIGECFCFATTGFLESCIQIGLIPANTDYGRLFTLGELSAVILDEQNRPIYRSKGERWPFPNREELAVHRVPISGGSLEWAADLSDLAALNRKLEENNHRLTQRSAYLREEGRMEKERVELETRNELYDRIARSVRPQLEEIEQLAEGEDFPARLPRICVLTAYVKRRSNMELMIQDGTLPVRELTAALEESAENLRLCGVSTAVQCLTQRSFPAKSIIAAYEHVQAIVSRGLDTLLALSVTLRAAGSLELRLLLQTRSMSWDFGIGLPGSNGVTPQIQVTKEGDDLVIVLRFPEGGEAP